MPEYIIAYHGVKNLRALKRAPHKWKTWIGDLGESKFVSSSGVSADGESEALTGFLSWKRKAWMQPWIWQRIVRSWKSAHLKSRK